MSSNTNLGNTPVNQGYVQLIHTGETGGIDGTLRTLYDGDGTASDLQIASNKVKVSTELYIGSKTATEFIQDIVGDMFTTGSYTNITTTYDDTNGNIDLSASGEVTLTGTQTLTNKTLASPTFTGDILFNDASTPVFTVKDTTNNVQADWRATDTLSAIGTTTDSPFYLKQNGNFHVTINSNQIILNTQGEDRNTIIKDSSGTAVFKVDAGTSTTEIGTLSVTGNATVTGNLVADSIDVAGDLTLDADGADIILKDGGTEYGRLSQVLGGLTLKSGSSGANAVVFSSDGNTAIFAGGVQISGDLTVQGDTTTLNTATLQVEDKNIVMNYHATNDTSGSADGAGITIQDAVNSTTDATMLWDATNDEFDFSHTVTAPNFTGNLTGNVTGNASGLSSTLGVSGGGTGATSLTSNAVLTGNGTSAIQAESNLTFDASDKTLLLDGTGASAELATFKWYQNEVQVAGAGTGNAQNITLNATHGTTLNTLYRYKITLTTRGTGTDTGAVYIVSYNEPTTTWEARMVSRGGSTSNHPLLNISGSNAQAYHNHASTYYIAYSVESKYVRESDGTFHNFGADYHWQRDVDTLSYSDGDVNIDSNTLFVDASTDRVGIGVSNPSRKLQVAGAIELSASDNTLDTNHFALRRDSGGGGNLDVPGSMTINLDANNNETTAQFEICHDGGSTPVFKVQENGYTTAKRYYLEDTGAVIYRNSNDLELITYSGYDINLMPSGNVGIGTTTPEVDLHIVDDTYTQFRVETSGAGNVEIETQANDNSDEAFFGTRSNHDLKFRTNWTNAMTIDTSQRVGIGTTSPTDTLQVEGSIGVGVGRDGQLTSVNNGLAMRSLVSDADMYFYVNDGGVDTLAMKIDASEVGKVKLPNDLQYLEFGAGGDGIIYSYQDDFWIQNVTQNQDIKFRVNDGGVHTDALFIQGSTTNVGIGTTSPSVKLDVAGGDIAIDATQKLYLDGGTHTYIDEVNSDQLRLVAGGTEVLKGYSGGAIDMYGGSINRSINIGANRTADAASFIDLVGDTTYTDYGARLIRNSGANAITDLTHRGTGALRLRCQDAGAVLFMISDAEKMRVASSGNVGIGVTSPGSKLHVQNGATSYTWSPYAGTTAIFEGTGSNHSIVSIVGSTTGQSSVWFGDTDHQSKGRVRYEHSNDRMEFWTNGTERLSIDSSGDIKIEESLGIGVAASSTTGRLDCSNDVVAFSTSDKRLKENVKPLDSALDKVLKINGVEFDWKELNKEEKKTIHGNEGHDVGVIAQEVEEVLPEVVTTRESGYKAVKYEKIVPLLIEAIKEQQKQIEELKNG